MNTSMGNSHDSELKLFNLNMDEIEREIKPFLKLAVEFCGVPFSLVNLSAGKQEHRMITYGDLDKEDVPAIQSICGKLLSEQDVAVVNNIREHPEIKTALSKKDLETIGFYAGAPLRSESGDTIGSMCLFDFESRDLTESQKKCLKTLANETVLRLQNIQQKNSLQEKNKMLEKQSILLKNSTDITFVVHSETGKIMDVNSYVEELLGYTPNHLLNTEFIELLEADKNAEQIVKEWVSPENKIDGRYSVDVLLTDKQDEKRWFQCNFTRENNLCYVTARDIHDQKKAESGIRELKGKFQKVVNVATDLVYELDWDSGDLSWGDELTDILGYPYEERYVDYDWWLDKIHPDDLDEVIYDVAMTVEGEREKTKLVYRIKTYDGSYKYVMNHKYVDREEDGSPDKIVGVIVDISDLKEAEGQTKWHQKLLEEVAEKTLTAIWVRNQEGEYLYSNQKYKSLFGVGEEKVKGKTVQELFDENIARKIIENDQKILKSDESQVFDEIVNMKSDKRFYRSNVFPVNGNKVGGVSVDITDEVEIQENLRNSLEEKETLLREIHHRVKNNLAIVSGILHLQWYKEGDKQVQKKLLDSTNRIKTMATIHELLYQASSFTHLNLDENIRRLVDSITSSYEVSVDLDVNYDLESIDLNINQAIPFSLIINEVVTNVLKHAFDEGESGKLSVSLFKEKGRITLTIKDDGKELPDDFDPIGKDETLGMELIETLASQLIAKYSYRSIEQGTQFTLSFEKTDGKGAGSSYVDESES